MTPKGGPISEQKQVFTPSLATPSFESPRDSSQGLVTSHKHHTIQAKSWPGGANGGSRRDKDKIQ